MYNTFQMHALCDYASKPETFFCLAFTLTVAENQIYLTLRPQLVKIPDIQVRCYQQHGINLLFSRKSFAC